MQAEGLRGPIQHEVYAKFTVVTCVSGEPAPAMVESARGDEKDPAPPAGDAPAK